MAMGKVYLVGAGPGDPGLLTVKGRRCIQQADAIVYDRLASPRLLTDAKPNVELYFVGKESDLHTVPQADIEDLLVSLANRNLSVVRLKGGDPFVFGRGGEEAAELEAAGVPWEVVPGITSAVSVPAYAGIPVTYRNVSPSFTVVTGHRSKEGHSLDWPFYARLDGTLVILMGVRQLDEIVDGLICGGMLPTTPAAMIRWGTRAKQETLRANLGELVHRAREAHFKAPCVIVIGDVAARSHRLPWYEQMPLMGKRLFLLASSQQELNGLQHHFERLGAETFGLYTEHLAVSADNHKSAVEKSIGHLIDELLHKSPDTRIGVQFQSSYGVEAFFKAALQARIDFRTFADITFVAATDVVETCLAAHGFYADCVSTCLPNSGDVSIWWHEADFNRGQGVVQEIDATADVNRRLSGLDVRQFKTGCWNDKSPWIHLAKEWMAEGLDGVCTVAGSEGLLQPFADVIPKHVPSFALQYPIPSEDVTGVVESLWRDASTDEFDAPAPMVPVL